MGLRTFIIGIGTLLAFTGHSLAQQTDSIPKKENDTTNRVPLDTIAMDMEGVKQMELMSAPSGLEGNPLLLTKEKNHYALKDHPKAAKFDSLWLNELSENASLFDAMYEEVSQLDVETVPEYTLDTETLKKRLEA